LSIRNWLECNFLKSWEIAIVRRPRTKHLKRGISAAFFLTEDFFPNIFYNVIMMFQSLNQGVWTEGAA
jgi:hypothetical protein